MGGRETLECPMQSLHRDKDRSPVLGAAPGASCLVGPPSVPPTNRVAYPRAVVRTQGAHLALVHSKGKFQVDSFAFEICQKY